MNILVPDAWFRDFLKTDATPKQLKEYLSLCGPSVERINKVGKNIVYDIEVTTNRPDSMSVFGIAREAAAILPRFGIPANLIHDPYSTNYSQQIEKFEKNDKTKIHIETDSTLNPRWTSILLENVAIKPSPAWLQKRLELTGIRPLNNVIDITNYLMRMYGQPAHAFDFEEIKPKDGLPFLKLRSARNGEHLTTLDGKKHSLKRGDIVIEDGAGRLIDLCGIMGAENSSIKKTTTKILLFTQTYNPSQIRKTMMRLSHRTEAGSLFEKDLDPELVLPTLLEGLKLLQQYANAKVASSIDDIYPQPFSSYCVECSRDKLDRYIGKRLEKTELNQILSTLGFTTKISKELLSIDVPSFRRDVIRDVDVIEEVARIYGYHSITTRLPDTEPPVVYPQPILALEHEIKIRLRDWGFTETYTYSFISEELMDLFKLDKQKAYKIANPLSSDWVYMRPTLTPSLLLALKQNIHLADEIKLFELSMVYKYKENDLPIEEPNLMVMWKGDRFLEAKGLAQALFALIGIPFPSNENNLSSNHLTWYTQKKFELNNYGALGVMDPELLARLDIHDSVTRLYLNLSAMVQKAHSIQKGYTPIPKYTPVIEDFTFEFPSQTPIGSVIETINAQPLVSRVNLISVYENAVSFRVWFEDTARQLTTTDVENVRQTLITTVSTQFKGVLKGSLH